MISTQFLQNCQAGDEEAISTLVRTHQRGVFQLALSILDDAPIARDSLNEGNNEPDSGAAARSQIAKSVSEAAVEAEAATRQTFTVALDRLGRYREDIPFNLWLYGIALDVSKRRLRQWRLRKWWWRIGGRFIDQAWDAISGSNLRDAAPVFTDPSNFLPGNIEMWSAVRGLNDRLRIPVVLHYYHELPIDEIALLMHLSEGAVHARLDSAREKISRALEK